MSILKTTSVLLSVPQENVSQLINKEVRHVLLEAVKSNEKEIATEGWHVCTSLTQYYPSEARSLWASFAPNNLHPLPISSASLKYMESYANLIQDECNESDQQWWKEMIVNYMQQAASNESSVVRAAACDCFASLTKTVFEKLDVGCLCVDLCTMLIWTDHMYIVCLSKAGHHFTLLAFF